MPSSDEDLKRFYAQKPIAPKVWRTVEIYQPNIGVRRYVRDFVSHDLQIETGAPRNAGEIVTFDPLGLEWELPQQNNEGDIAISVAFPRIGIDFKQQLKQLSPWDIMNGAEIILRRYLSTVAAPRKFYYLNAQTITINGRNATIPATDDNPTNQRTARLYSFDNFPGLEDI